MEKLFFARKAGITIAHNLTEQEVYELRLRPDALSVTIFEQDARHNSCLTPFCPECAEHAADMAQAQALNDLKKYSDYRICI